MPFLSSVAPAAAGAAAPEASSSSSSSRPHSGFVFASTTTRFRVLSGAVAVLGTSLLLSIQSTSVLRDVYMSLADLRNESAYQRGGGALASSGTATTAAYQQGGALAGSAASAAAASAAGSSSHPERLRPVVDDKSTTHETKPKKKKTKDMNIALFYADDWTWRTLGFVNGVVKTPHIDEMARNGMSFSHNCVTSSICWQSRATKSTGLYVAVHQQLRIWDENMFDKTVRWRQTLYPQLFGAGYNVGFFGKWHAQMPKRLQKYTFDHFENYWGDHWMERDGKRRHVTDVNKEDALNYLRNIQRDWGRPNRTSETKDKFALTVSFYATHGLEHERYPDQYQPMNSSEPLYEGVVVPVPPTATDEAWEAMPWFFAEDNHGRIRWRQRFDTPEHYQETMKRMFRMASEADDVVGAVVKELKKMGVYENTLLVFTTDNGNFHGEHGLADKWYPHEESIRVPLIIQDPRMPDHLRGTMNDEFTLNIDLAPTLLSAAGISPPKFMQGRDIAELYLGDPEKAAQSWRKDFFYEWSQGRPEDASGHPLRRIPAVFALVRRDYKYFYWPQLGYEQLFHVAVDPFEEHDIINATDPAKVAELKARYFELKNLSQQGYRV